MPNTKNADENEYWFAKVDVDVLGDKSLSPMTRFIFTVLCKFANSKSRKCYPSVKTIADFAGVSTRTVDRAIKELETKGIIARKNRKNPNGRTSSITTIIGYKASCYSKRDNDSRVVNQNGVHDSRVVNPTTPESYKIESINENQIKDSLTGKPAVSGDPDSEFPIAFDNTQPGNPEEVYSPKDAPASMKTTAEYLLLKTGRKAFTWDEISSLRTLAADHVPARVQHEIDIAVDRFTRKSTPLDTLTFSYIAGSLKHQTSRGKSRKPKPAPIELHPELAPSEIEFTDEDIAAMEADLARRRNARNAHKSI